MAQAIRAEQVTPADLLRDLLATCEERIPNLRGRDAQIEHLLLDLDRIAELWPQLEAGGADLRPEAGRWETIQALVHKNAAAIVGKARVDGGYAALRSRHHGTGEAAWWWHLDQEARHNRILRIRRTVLGLLAFALLAAAAIFIVDKVIPSDPKYQAAVSKLMDGQSAIEQGGDFAAAEKSFQQATVLTPDNAEAWLWLGAAQQKLGETAASNASYARARQILGNDLDFYVQRAMPLMGVGLLDAAQADLNAALAIDPQEPTAHLYMANLYQMRGQTNEAMNELEAASQYAEERNQPELTAIARYRLAMIYQSLQTQLPQPSGATPTPR